MIEDGLELNSQTFEGETALLIATQQKSLQAMQILLDAGAFVNLSNHEDVTPLHCGTGKVVLVS